MKQFVEDIIKLRRYFKITESKKWDFYKGVNELIVQIGHLGIALHSKFKTEDFEEVREKGRIIENIADELSDCLLQVVPLMLSVGFSEKEVLDVIQKRRVSISQTPVQVQYQKLIIIASQLVESSMKIFTIRFAKKRDDYYTSEESFIRDRLSQFLVCLLDLYTFFEIDIYQSFYDMREEAENFLSYYSNFKKKNISHSRELAELKSTIEHRVDRIIS